MAASFEIFARVAHDINSLMAWLSRYPWSNPVARRREIYAAFDDILTRPELRPVQVRRRKARVELRRWNVRQFAIIYSYEPPSLFEPHGRVSIRAVRHSRERNVFHGVREVAQQGYSTAAA